MAEVLHREFVYLWFLFLQKNVSIICSVPLENGNWAFWG